IKSIACWSERLQKEGLEVNDENIFIAAACDEKGIAFLKGESPLNVRKKSDCNDTKCETNKTEIKEEKKGMSNATGNYTVIVDGQKFNVTVAEGGADIQVTPVASTPAPQAQPQAQTSNVSGTEVPATVNGNVWKILVKEGDRVAADQTIIILEAMKMEIDIKSPVDGVVKAIKTTQNESVSEGQPLAVIG
ncbi:MAG: biotin/lipoyl-containing protein, partial [Arcobacteraceae bacterium]